MTTIETLEHLDGVPHANVFPGSEPKTVRLTLTAGQTIAPHDHPDREIVFYLVEGAVTLDLGEATHELSTGEIARFDGDQQISPTATEPSTALLVLAPQAEE